jgi:hypothetical protein
MNEERKITIIEGPTPEFEAVQEEAADFLAGVLEGPSPQSYIALTRVRALNGPALVERCHRAWRERESIYLEFRTPVGLVQQVPIVAVRYIPTEEGDVLMLWVMLPLEVIEHLADGTSEDEDDLDELPPF